MWLWLDCIESGCKSNNSFHAHKIDPKFEQILSKVEFFLATLTQAGIQDHEL